MAENNGNNNNKNGKNNKNSNLRGVLTLIAWALVLTVAFNYFNAYNHNTANKTTSHEIKYSEMIDMVEKNQVEEILFKDSTIYVTPVEGYVYTEEVTSGGKTEEKSYKQTEDGSLTLYTAYLSNSELLPLLKEHRVAYTGYYEAEMNPILLLMINYILPVISLSMYPMAYITRLTKTSMLDALNQDYIRTARAKGVASYKVIFKHALRNALIPVVTYVGPMVAFIITGSMVVETIFSTGGLGSYFVTSINNRDYTLIMGVTIFLAILMVTANLITDIVYKLIDPRITFD